MFKTVFFLGLLWTQRAAGAGPAARFSVHAAAGATVTKTVSVNETVPGWTASRAVTVIVVEVDVPTTTGEILTWPGNIHADLTKTSQSHEETSKPKSTKTSSSKISKTTSGHRVESFEFAAGSYTPAGVSPIKTSSTTTTISSTLSKSTLIKPATVGFAATVVAAAHPVGSTSVPAGGQAVSSSSRAGLNQTGPSQTAKQTPLFPYILPPFVKTVGAAAQSVAKTSSYRAFPLWPLNATSSAARVKTPSAARVNTSSTSTAGPSASSTEEPGKKVALYYGNWDIYGAQFLPDEVPVKQITHLYYAFATVEWDGTVQSSDPWADLQRGLGNQLPSYSGSIANGCVQQLFMIKQKNRHVKTLLSIGGSAYSQQGVFSSAARTASTRRIFAKSAVKLLADWGFDGIDIAWDGVSTPAEAEALVELLMLCRLELDAYAAANKQDYRYLLSVATSASPQSYEHLFLKDMDSFVDIWNLMAYDYSGAASNVTAHQNNLYPDPGNLNATPANTDQAVNDYLAHGVRASKLLLGLALYGRTFQETEGLGKPFGGVGADDLSQAGAWPYRDLPKPGAQVHFNASVGATYSYDPATGELVSYDDARSAAAKARYVVDRQLGGAVFWEAASDKAGGESLVGAVERALGPLERSPNMLDYPQSRYANIKSGRPAVAVVPDGWGRLDWRQSLARATKGFPHFKAPV